MMAATSSGLTPRLDSQSLPQRPHQTFPHPGIAPLAKVVVDGRPGWVIVREQTPSPSSAQDIKDPIENLAHIHAPGTASWFGWGIKGSRMAHSASERSLA